MFIFCAAIIWTFYPDCIETQSRVDATRKLKVGVYHFSLGSARVWPQVVFG